MDDEKPPLDTQGWGGGWGGEATVTQLLPSQWPSGPCEMKSASGPRRVPSVPGLAKAARVGLGNTHASGSGLGGGTVCRTGSGVCPPQASARKDSSQAQPPSLGPAPLQGLSSHLPGSSSSFLFLLPTMVLPLLPPSSPTFPCRGPSALSSFSL